MKEKKSTNKHMKKKTSWNMETEEQEGGSRSENQTIEKCQSMRRMKNCDESREGRKEGQERQRKIMKNEDGEGEGKGESRLM